MINVKQERGCLWLFAYTALKLHTQNRECGGVSQEGNQLFSSEDIVGFMARALKTAVSYAPSPQN